jgi:hypothetical protein
MDEEVPAEEAEASSAGGPTAEQATGDTGVASRRRRRPRRRQQA